MTLEQLGLSSDPPNGSGRERGATEKAKSSFQNLHEFMNDTYLSNERNFVPHKVENLI